MMEAQVKGQRISRPTYLKGDTSALRLACALIMLTGATAYAAMHAGGIQNGLAIMMAGFVGMYMAMNIGANDVANNVGVAVGSGALTMAGAIAIAVVFEAAGAILAGGDVVQTISKGIIDPYSIPRADFIGLMLAALLAAAVWVNIATSFGAPVSTTHSIVGSVLGAGIVAAGVSVVDWGVTGLIAASWVISPVLGGAIAAAFLALIKANIVYRKDKIAAARTWVPILVGIMAAVFAAYLAIKGLKGIWQPDMTTILAISGAAFAIVYMIVTRMVAVAAARMRNTREDVGRLFTIPLIVAAALLCFAHGSNDVANAIGPLAAIVYAASDGGGIAAKVSIPAWVMLIGTTGLAAGLALYGSKLVTRVGKEITEIDRLRAFAVALSAAITVIVASALALPVSSTHITLGAIIGVGVLREYLQHQNDRVRIIRELCNDKTEPGLFDTAKSELVWQLSIMEKSQDGPPSEHERLRCSEFKRRAESALKNGQRKKLVARTHLRTIIAAWLITVPATAVISGLLFLVIKEIVLLGNAL